MSQGPDLGQSKTANEACEETEVIEFLISELHWQ